MTKSRTKAKTKTKPRTKPRKSSGKTIGPRASAGNPGRHRRSVETKLQELKRRLREIGDLDAASALLGWDQATYMPTGGAAARARQGAMLRRLAHEQSVDPALGRLIDELLPYADNLSYDTDDASLIRVARRDFEKAIKVPPEFVARANALRSASFDAWTRARPANDFATMLPFLERNLELSREYADFFRPYDHIADPLINDADEGMSTASVRALFAARPGADGARDIRADIGG